MKECRVLFIFLICFLLSIVTTTVFGQVESKHSLGISAGFGLGIPIKSNIALSCEVRNNLGLVNTRSAPILEEEGVVKTNSTNLLLGIIFTLE